MKTPELDRWMELNAAADMAETQLLQRMIKVVTFGDQKPDSFRVEAYREMRAAGLAQLDRALAEMKLASHAK